MVLNVGLKVVLVMWSGQLYFLSYFKKLYFEFKWKQRTESLNPVFLLLNKQKLVF